MSASDGRTFGGPSLGLSLSLLGRGRPREGLFFFNFSTSPRLVAPLSSSRAYGGSPPSAGLRSPSRPLVRVGRPSVVVTLRRIRPAAAALSEEGLKEGWTRCFDVGLEKRRGVPSETLSARWAKFQSGCSLSLKAPSSPRVLVYGHTTSKTPVLVRSPKSSDVGPGQYLDG